MASNSKRKRNVLNIETKLEILNRFVNGECRASLAKFYNVGKSTILFKVNNNNESCKGPSNADAFSALKTAMEWYEQRSECCPTQLLLLKRIRDLAVKKKRCTMIPRKISDYFPQ
ncbi:uncharacterized protein TNCV_4309451 [Trichonephila clavipes]|nr:uncharacterized protein TNCV_4309451 [Trichonephila clavipes]